MTGNNDASPDLCVAEEVPMRLEIRMTAKLFDLLEKLGREKNVSAGRVAGLLIAQAVGMKDEDALPPFRPTGRPRKQRIAS